MDSTKTSLSYSQTTINCGGKLLDLSEPKVMGILNLTPDSFYDGGKFTDEMSILEQVNTMLTEGAAIIDLGGTSARPGATPVSLDDELNRVIPLLKSINRQFSEAIISIDTARSEVARQAVSEGATIVNDISAGRFDEELWTTVSELGVPYVLMHMQGSPEDMQTNPQYDDVVVEVVDFLSARLNELRELGVKDVIIDPGFGFGKSVEHNYSLLANLNAFRMFELPILVGVSRKSMVCKPLQVNPEEALNGTTALHVMALLHGASILRAHDVREAIESIRLVGLYKGQLSSIPELELA